MIANQGSEERLANHKHNVSHCLSKISGVLLPIFVLSLDQFLDPNTTLTNMLVKNILMCVTDKIGITRMSPILALFPI